MMVKNHLRSDYSYIGVFLTLNCPLSCSYCLNHYSSCQMKRQELKPESWLVFFNSLDLPSTLPLTFQGGEPSFYPGFWSLLSGLKKELKIDLLTNLEFDLQKFSKYAKRDHFTRTAPYASIRVSFHPESMDWNKTLEKVLYLQKEGFRVGLYMVSHPNVTNILPRLQEEALKAQIDFRLKEFLGEYQGKLYGQYKYDQTLKREKVECRSSELLLSPEGKIYRCHRDLYAAENDLGDIHQVKELHLYEFRPCFSYGQCHPCDIKIKNNRFQEFGHTSVEIREL